MSISASSGDLAGALATRHAGAPAHDGPRVAGYAESGRTDDWSLRSALVRFAQPEPVRAGAVLELVRRTDGALHPHLRLLESTEVATDPALSAARLADDVRDGLTRDARAVDLARVLDRFDDGEEIVARYAEIEGVGDEELGLVPVLRVALVLDDLGDTLTTWAAHCSSGGPEAPPVDVVDAACARAFEWLAAAGVPRETGPPPRGRRSRG